MEASLFHGTWCYNSDLNGPTTFFNTEVMCVSVCMNVFTSWVMSPVVGVFCGVATVLVLLFHGFEFF